MVVVPIRTDPVRAGDNLNQILARAIPALQEKSIVVITSKIVSLTEGRFIPQKEIRDKASLIKSEADMYIGPVAGKFNLYLTITRGMLIANAGIDESNADGGMVLWPKHPMESAKRIWLFLRKHYQVESVGVIISDSRIVPMRWGTLGTGLAWCGFNPLKNYIGTPDLFGRKLRMTKSAVMDGIAASAVLVMGEGNEGTPLALVSDMPSVDFLDHPPTPKEIRQVKLSVTEDVYAPLTNSPKWKKGGGKNR